jgi:hypothetical protein
MRKTKSRSGLQQGAALVIAIFSLLLISVIATALIMTSGTQSAIKSNYKSATHAFYDAKAGLEEARGRLWANAANNPDSTAMTSCVFPTGAPMLVTQVCYITNPAPGENKIDPTNSADPYFDKEYRQEWGGSSAGAQLISSTSSTAALAGPLYKWVRITPRTEASANFDADADGRIDTTPLYFDGQNVVDSKNSLPPGAAQILTITSYAVTPSNGRRMVQYTVAPGSFLEALPTFPAALTLAGNGVSFTGPSGNPGTDNGNFQINGYDGQVCNPPPGTPSGIPAIGYTNSKDTPNMSALPSTNYCSPATPSVTFLASRIQTPNGISPVLETPSGLNGLAESITQSADLVLAPSPGGGVLDQLSLPATMSATNPMVVVVQGDFNLHGHGTGYGLLLVTGILDYDPDASWNGVILVIGKGIFTSSKAGVGVINGAVFVAQTRDLTGNLLPDPDLGASSFKQTGGGNGIHYSSSWVAKTQALIGYQVLSFREISQTTP